MASDLPPTLELLGTDLTAKGFSVISDVGAGWPGREVVFGRDTTSGVTAVRLISDRGIWGVEARLGESLWVGPSTALSDAEGRPVEQRAMSHEEQRRATLAAVERLSGSREERDAIEAAERQRTVALNRWASGQDEKPIGMRGPIQDRR